MAKHLYPLLHFDLGVFIFIALLLPIQHNYSNAETLLPCSVCDDAVLFLHLFDAFFVVGKQICDSNHLFHFTVALNACTFASGKHTQKR